MEACVEVVALGDIESGQLLNACTLMTIYQPAVIRPMYKLVSHCGFGFLVVGSCLWLWVLVPGCRDWGQISFVWAQVLRILN